MKYRYRLVSTSNEKLDKDGIVSINMPPLKSCPGAGLCKVYCFAQVGRQAMGAAKKFRIRAFNLFKRKPTEFEEIAIQEIHRAGRRIFRWHDSGDIVCLEYLKMMVRVSNIFKDIKFYTYTKSISIVKEYGFNNLPPNLNVEGLS